MKKGKRRWTAGILAAVMLVSTAFPATGSYRMGETVLTGTESDWAYCIDSYELLGEAGGVLGGVNEEYTCVPPSARLSGEECAWLFWGTLTMLADRSEGMVCRTILEKINSQAAEAGLMPITRNVTEQDLKKLIHLKSVRDKYPWLEAVTAKAESYMKLGGLLGGSEREGGGKEIPAVLQGHTDVGLALSVDSHTCTISFDAAGADREFIQKVPLQYSLTGGEPWSGTPPAGWNCRKTDQAIIFTAINPNPPRFVVRFDPAGTEFQRGGGYQTPEELYDQGMQLWVCTRCSNLHVYHSKRELPLEAHQRMVNLQLDMPIEQYYAAIGGQAVQAGQKGRMQFQIYRHEEEMVSTYNLQFYKYDYETGKPLEQAAFKLYERFDDWNEIDREKDGPAHLFEGGGDYQSFHKDQPVVWDDFRFVSGMVTDEKGYAAKTVNHGYHYDKTFCDGHPAPEFVHVPEEEEDDETGEILNEAEIEAAQSENMRLAQKWLDCAAACEEQGSGEFFGVHFHWLMGEVDRGEVESISSNGGFPGETPRGGKTTSAPPEEAYDLSGCKQDCEDTYERFIGLRYSYALKESSARAGYILHGIHADDLPVEVITTDASEHGANAFFSGEYGNQIEVKEPIEWKPLEVGAADRQVKDREEPSQDGEEYRKVRITPIHYVQKLVRMLFPDRKQEANFATSDRWEEEQLATPDHWQEMELVNDLDERSFFASPSDWIEKTEESEGEAIPFFYTEGEAESPLFSSAYAMALHGGSSGEKIKKGSPDRYSHCSDRDGEGNAWRIYDHRTEGELHINKRDMKLQSGESKDYSAYGDAQGDATLEGAVYGLFAAADILHPDGKTGVIYRANNLVATAVSDSEGNLSFFVNTEAPGMFYDYTKGKTAETADGWASAAPENLYTSDSVFDDYAEDHAYDRRYQNLEKKNGNCWIGRPLFMGRYYVKELTRSEGYELSIGNRDNSLTNRGQNEAAGIPAGTGYAGISKRFYAEGQISADPTGEYNDPDINELFFEGESRKTGEAGFDLVFTGIPKGAKLYRLDIGMEEQKIEVGTGQYKKISLTKPDGSPVYVTVQYEGQYPRYQEDGSLMMKETAVSCQTELFQVKQTEPFDEGKVQEAVLAEEQHMDQNAVFQKLQETFDQDEITFIKAKVERAFRTGGRSTPKVYQEGKVQYSTPEEGIYNEGIWAAEKEGDHEFGVPVRMLEIPCYDEEGNPIRNGDVILSILDFYFANSFYSFGGVHSIEAEADCVRIQLYAGFQGNPENYMEMGSGTSYEGAVFHRVNYLPDDKAETPRYQYAVYSKNSDSDRFGVYKTIQERVIGDRCFLSVLLKPDAKAEGDGTLVCRTRMEPQYYPIGDIPYDKEGNPIQAFRYEEETEMVSRPVEKGRWIELPLKEKEGVVSAHIDSAYGDSFGISHNDDELQKYVFRVVLPVREVALEQEDLAAMQDSSGWNAGDQMGSASYYLNVAHAGVQAYLDHENLNITGDSSFVKQAELIYPGQQFIWQDGDGVPGTGTRKQPIGVQERVIRQKIKVVKNLDGDSYGENDTYTAVHEDWWTKWFGGFGNDRKPALKTDNFRFKTYLKSNLERLYRNYDGIVVWQDRWGTETDPWKDKLAYPALVRKIYTKVSTGEDGKPVANTELYSLADGKIKDTPNSGYTAVLESTGGSAEKKTYNYEKFMDGLAVANHDKWDEAAPAYTSWYPLGNSVNRIEETLENMKYSDAVRQFAMKWYLKEEVSKATRSNGRGEEREALDGSVSYTEELFDRALNQALVKAENYLRPFFLYDLDEIYGILWDGEPEGGKDGDYSTLSADVLEGEEELSAEDGYYYGISAYLPYGTYVVTEQQPKETALGDFKNKHYKIQKPKEVVLPSVYNGYERSGRYQGRENPFYFYDPQLSKEELERRYRIRMLPDRLPEAGSYAAVLVPYSVLEPTSSQSEKIEMNPQESGESSYSGYCYIDFLNRLYTTRLRIEKLDSQTHENILHDEALFHIYAAKREDQVQFFEEPTMIAGTKEFLEDMGASDIRPMKRTQRFFERMRKPLLGPGNLYTGVVPEGTPICEENEQVILAGTGTFSTVRGDQTVGYLETSRPLGAGCYVLCERKAPSGYMRSKPIALEIYSDQVTYYKEGDRDKRVAAALIEYDVEDAENLNERSVARIYVENHPTMVQVEKVKESSREGAETSPDKTITYRVSGRIDGSLTEIGNDPDYVYAYRDGEYLGYGWKKGTLAYLLSRKHAGEQVELVYDGDVFSGYGYVTRSLETADDENPYVTGAWMTLFKAKELKKSGDTEDQAYENLVVERNFVNRVERVYLQEEQEETDLLYYDLADLQILEKEGTVYAYRDGIPYLEFSGGDKTKIDYDSKNKIFSIDPETKIYHLDLEENRDSLVDPYTGMAYVAEQYLDASGKPSERIFAWAVHVRKDTNGNVIANDKITTSRIAVVDEGKTELEEETGYITGSWKRSSIPLQINRKAANGSHREISLKQNEAGQNLNGEVLIDDNHGAFLKDMSPVYDAYGLAVYYQNSGEHYEKGTDLYDRDETFVRHQDSDNLEAYNRTAYEIQEQERLYDGEEQEESQRRSPLYHRKGENYILENTWISSDETPNDPFHNRETEGQPDLLKRVPAGAYILEELKAPAGYRKGMPAGILVAADQRLHQVKMINQTTKLEISKVDGAKTRRKKVHTVSGAAAEKELIEEGGSYSNGMVKGAELALFEAEKIYTADTKRYPKGYYLQKTGTDPVVYASTNSRAGNREFLTARWITGETPIYAEGIPEGYYILEELWTPEGFVTAEPMEIEITGEQAVHHAVLYEDHTKLQIEKYSLDGTEKEPVSGAGFTLYPVQEEEPRADRKEKGEEELLYDKEHPIVSWVSSDGEKYRGFVTEFEHLYQDYGCQPGTSLCWDWNGQKKCAVFVSAEVSELDEKHPSEATLLFETEDGEQIRITVYEEKQSRFGTDFTFEYQFDYRKLEQVNDYAASWFTLEGRRRIDYLPVGRQYVLVEEMVPSGYGKAGDTLIQIPDTDAIQHYGIENHEGRLWVSKTAENSEGRIQGELAGAHMALYRAEDDGSFVQDEDHLVTDWITGMDGRYTEEDERNGRIPKGYEIGDLRLHEIRKLENGIYWLAELSCPAYYTLMRPQRIEYDREESMPVIRVKNIPARGLVTVRKTDSAGALLKGVVYELSAYRKGDGRNPVFRQQIADCNGTIEVSQLPVGEQQMDGTISPYTYKLREVVPPDGYAVNPEVFRWQFEPDQKRVSYEWGEQAEHKITVKNEKTRIVIRKRDFDQPGSQIPEGAELAIYQVGGRDDHDQILYDEENPFDVWVTSKEEPDHTVVGMTAGETYLLVERNVPEGYQKMEPVLFSLSEDGRSIVWVDHNMNSVDVSMAEDGRRTVTIRGRYGRRTMYELLDDQKDSLLIWIGTKDGYELTREQAKKAGIKEGNLYVIQERTCYSDGLSPVTGRWTERIVFDENGTFQIPTRTVTSVQLLLEEETGVCVGDFQPSEFVRTLKIQEQEDRLFRNGENYVLREVTEYSDGTEKESSKFGFCMEEDLLIRRITVLDRKTNVSLSKTEISGETEVPGNELCIRDMEGEVIDQWISGATPHIIEGILKEGESYVMEEVCPKPGYSYAEKICFTVSGGGAEEIVRMRNDRTAVMIRKEDAATGQLLSGAKFEIRDLDGTCLHTWISSSGSPDEEAGYHMIKGILTAGETYLLHETEAPFGYERMEDMVFTVPKGRDRILLVAKNRKKIRTERPDVPEKPERLKERKIGTISAVYQPDSLGIWNTDAEYKDGWLRFLPNLGDQSEHKWKTLIFLLSAAGVLLLLYQKPEKNRKKKRGDKENAL